jgi:hypothetical protein
LAFGWRPIGQLSFSLGGSVLLPQRTLIRAAPAAGGSMFAAGLRARGCAHAPPLASFDLAGCAGAELAFLRARGFGVTTLRRETTAGVAPFGTLTLTYPVNGGVALSAWIEGLLPTVRPIFVLDGVGEIHRTPAIVGRAGLAAEVRFP